MRRERETPGVFPILLDYPVRSKPRYGHGQPAHPELFALLNADREKYAERLRQFIRFKERLERIPVEPPSDARAPYWRNGFLQGLDPVSLYGFASLQKPRLYIEIGSGNSTKFLRRAVEDQDLPTRMVSIDPHPRAEINALCDEILREPLEDVDLAVCSVTWRPGTFSWSMARIAYS